MGRPVTVTEIATALRNHLADADHPHSEDEGFEDDPGYGSIHMAEDVSLIEGEPGTLGLALTTGERFFITVEEV